MFRDDSEIGVDTTTVEPVSQVSGKEPSGDGGVVPTDPSVLDDVDVYILFGFTDNPSWVYGTSFCQSCSPFVS